MSLISTIARAVGYGNTPKPARAYLIRLDPFGGDAQKEQRSFQYFPSTITDSQATNYQTKVIPGLSHPLYQWTSGGARTISFEAIFTRDRAYTSSELTTLQASGSTGIASPDDDRNVDIPGAVAWLRSFLLPDYSSDSNGTSSGVPLRPHPPSKAILNMPGVRLNTGVAELHPDEIYVIMTGCEVAYDGFFTDGTPRMAKVALTFAEIIQVGGQIKVQSAFNRRKAGLNLYKLGSK